MMIVTITTSWAQEADPDISFTLANSTFANYFKTYTIGTNDIVVGSSATSISSGNGGYYVDLGSTGSGFGANYINVKAPSTVKIAKVSVYATGSGNSKAIKAPVFGFSEEWDGTTTNADNVDYIEFTSASSNGGKYNTADWFDVDVSSWDASEVRIYRSIKGITVTGTEIATSETVGNGQTLRVWGLKVWLKDSTPTHTVTYSLGDGSSETGAPTQAAVAEGKKFTVADAPSDLEAPTGQEFKCWNDGTNDYIEGAEYTMGTSDVTLTAVYQAETVKYAVSYAAGEGTGTMEGASKAAGAEFYLPESSFTEPEGKLFSGWLCNIDETIYAAGDSYTMTAAATTFTAQYVAVAQKIIYSLVDGIGSAEKTANTATVTEGTSLVISDSKGLITITAVTGDTFKNGDAIAFSGTIGNTAKAYGIKYGASSAGTNLYVAAGQPCSVSGTLSLTSNSNTLVMGRYDGTTTTMTDFVVSRTVGVSSESIANIYINGVSATEGTDYTVSGNTITLSKTYFACPVVRISGNATFTDATTGKTNHPVTLALDEDAYTGTTTIAGTTYTVNVPYKGGESIDLSNTTGYNYGFGGYCAPENFTLTGGTAYAAQIVNDKIVLTSYDTEYIPKNTGVIIAGDKGASVTITYTTTTTPNLAFPDNDLKGTTARTATATLKGSASKFLTLQKSTSKFIQYTGEYFPANRAYLLISGESAPESLEMVFADEATAIKEVNAGENANSAIPVKVVTAKGIQIGKYNVAGQQVK